MNCTSNKSEMPLLLIVVVVVVAVVVAIVRFWG